MCPASIQLVWGGGAVPALPKPSLPAERATDRRRLNTPLKSLADALAPDRLLVDCGGEGQCGPNALAFLLGLLGRFEGDGYGLRREIVHFVRTSDVLGHATAFTWKDHPDSRLTCRDLLVENMKGWPRDVIAGRPLSPDTWCDTTVARDAWTDLTFVQLCASRFKVTVNLIGVDDLGRIHPMFPVEPTPASSQAEAACDMGCWLGNHFVAVVDCESPPSRSSTKGGQSHALDADARGNDVAHDPAYGHNHPHLAETAAGQRAAVEENAGDQAPLGNDTPVEAEVLQPQARHPTRRNQPNCINLNGVTRWAVALMHVAVLVQPLVYAHVNGFTVLGALPESSPKKAASQAAQTLCDSMWGHKVHTFLSGVHREGWKLFAAPVDYAPPENTICRSIAQRKIMSARGAGFMWMTLSALQATLCYSAAAQVMLSVQCFIKPPALLSELALNDRSGSAAVFKTGAVSTTSRLGFPPLDNSRCPVPWVATEWLQRQDGILRDLLTAQDDPMNLLSGWADQIKPSPLDEIPGGLLSSLPSFHDPALSLVELPASPKPYRTP